MPAKKEVEYLDKEHKFLINQKKDKQFIDIKTGTKFHAHAFMILKKHEYVGAVNLVG